MSFQMTFPSQGSTLSIDVKPNEKIFVLGANGAGKSRLMHHFFLHNTERALRITAQRQNFIEGSAVDLAPQARLSAGENVRGWNQNGQSTWLEIQPASRIQIAMFDLVEAQNQRARDIASALDHGNIDAARHLAGSSKPPLNVINDIFKLSNLPLTLSLGEHSQIQATKLQGQPYGVNRLSDGERNAFLLAASVLTAPAGQLILIDEPERHLHRSIISPLLAYLFDQRRDCAFIVSTHDVTLAVDCAPEKLLLIRGARFEGDNVAEWDASLVTNPEEIDEAFKLDILGARRKTLFVEGKARSLDNRLYGLIFPNASVVYRKTCREVIATVASINATSSLHWIQAFGIIDRDHRDSPEVARLAKQDVFAIPCYSVEAIYYCPKMQTLVAERKQKSEGGDAVSDVQRALSAALAAVARDNDYLVRRRVEMTLRHRALTALPSHSALGNRPRIEIILNVADELTAERKLLEGLMAEQNLLAILARYAVRDSGTLDAIAKALRFQDKQQYEMAVITALVNDAASLRKVRTLFRPLIRRMKMTE